MENKKLDVVLSEHFTLDEFTRSGTALSRHIDNTPSIADISRLQTLCTKVLEPLRKRFGAVRITSGYRSRRLNEAVGGAIGSQHLLGEAADIYVPNDDAARKYIDFIRLHLDWDQMIREPMGESHPRWLHVSFTTRRKNRRKCL
jgi:zinc D-Ala-D-Ala carboxypeptidase